MDGNNASFSTISETFHFHLQLHYLSTSQEMHRDDLNDGATEGDSYCDDGDDDAACEVFHCCYCCYCCCYWKDCLFLGF